MYSTAPVSPRLLLTALILGAVPALAATIAAPELLQRVEAGTLGWHNLRLAAFLSHPAALAALGAEAPCPPPAADLRELATQLTHWGRAVPIRAALSCAESLVGWVEQHGTPLEPVREALAAARAWVEAPSFEQADRARALIDGARTALEAVPGPQAFARSVLLAVRWALLAIEPGRAHGFDCGLCQDALEHTGNALSAAFGGQGSSPQLVTPLVLGVIRRELLPWALESAPALTAYSGVQAPRTRRHAEALPAVWDPQEALAGLPWCGSVELQDQPLAARIARGELSRERVELAAFLGHEPARRLLGLTAPSAVDEPWLRGLPLWGPAACGRVVLLSLSFAFEDAEEEPSQDEVTAFLQQARRTLSAGLSSASRAKLKEASRAVKPGYSYEQRMDSLVGALCYDVLLSMKDEPSEQALRRAMQRIASEVSDPAELERTARRGLLEWALGLPCP